MVFRTVFLTLSVLAVGGLGYVSYYGYGQESRDLDRSVRTGSNGGVFVGGRVK